MDTYVDVLHHIQKQYLQKEEEIKKVVGEIESERQFRKNQQANKRDIDSIPEIRNMVLKMLKKRYTITRIAEELDIPKSKVRQYKKEFYEKGQLINKSAVKRKEQEFKHSSFYLAFKLTPKQVEQIVKDIECGMSNEETAHHLGLTTGKVYRCRVTLSRYGVKVRKGCKTVYPEGFWEETNEQLQSQEQVKEQVQIQGQPKEQRVIDSNRPLSTQDKAKIIELKMGGASDFEVKNTLGISEELLQTVLAECKKYGIKF